MPDNSLSIDPAASAELNRRLGNSSAPLAGAVNEALGDHLLSLDELKDIVRRVYHVGGDRFVTLRAQNLLDRMVRIGNANSVVEQSEVGDLVSFLAGGDAHKIAGGVVVRNDLDAHNRLRTELFCPGLDRDRFQRNIVPYTIYRNLGSVRMSFSVPVTGQADQYHLFTYVTFLGRVWPALTRITFSRQGDTVRGQWSLVPRGERPAIINANRSGFAEALQAAGEDHDADDVQDAMDDFLNHGDRVRRSEGLHLFNLASGMYVYTNVSDVQWNSLIPTSRAIANSLEAALVTCGDPRAATRPEIPAWIYEGNSQTPSLDSLEPAD